MRFIYTVLLGLVIFQGLLVLFSMGNIFPGESEIAEGINMSSSESFTGYDPQRGAGHLVSEMLLSDNSGAAFGAFAFISVIGIVIAIALKLFVVAGAAFFIGIITYLYINTVSVLTNLNVTNNPIITGLFSLVGVLIGIIAIFSVTEMFAGQQGAT